MTNEERDTALKAEELFRKYDVSEVRVWKHLWHRGEDGIEVGVTIKVRNRDEQAFVTLEEALMSLGEQP